MNNNKKELKQNIRIFKNQSNILSLENTDKLINSEIVSIQNDIVTIQNAIDNINIVNDIYIRSLADLPTPLGNIITLTTGDYIFIGSIDLLGNRLACSDIVSIQGLSSETSYLTSTGLSISEYLITSTYSLPIQNITFGNVAKGIYVSGASSAIDWFAVNFVNVIEAAYVNGVSDFILISCMFNTSKIRFDGTIGTVSFLQTIFSDFSGGNIITIEELANITRRFRVSQSSFITNNGAIYLVVSSSVPDDQFILDRCNFSGGSSNFLIGITETSNKADFNNNKGIKNSYNYIQYGMTDNLTDTIMGSPINTYKKILGVTVVFTSTRFTQASSNLITYTGSIIRSFLVTATITASTGNNQTIGFRIAKNGITIPQSQQKSTTSGTGRSENTYIHCIVELSVNDTISIYTANVNNNNNILVSDLTVIINEN